LVGVALEDLIVCGTRSDPDILSKRDGGEAGGCDNQWLGAHQIYILPIYRANYLTGRERIGAGTDSLTVAVR
jgi:hypothetical protein